MNEERDDDRPRVRQADAFFKQGDAQPAAQRALFRGGRRWLALSVIGVAVIATALVLRVTTGPRNGYDVVFSLGTLLLILGAFLTGWATRRQHFK